MFTGRNTCHDVYHHASFGTTTLALSWHCLVQCERAKGAQRRSFVAVILRYLKRALSTETCLISDI